MKRNKNKVFIKFSPKEDSRINDPLYVAEYKICTGTSALVDDIGKPFVAFNDIESLKVCDIPEQLTNNKYTLVGKQYYAPYSKSKEIYCALFAQTDNEYDENAIKILRWLPKSRTETGNKRRLNAAKLISTALRINSTEISIAIRLRRVTKPNTPMKNNIALSTKKHCTGTIIYLSSL